MKILIAHNYYRSEAPSGENIAVDADIDLLQKNGHEVNIFARHSDSIAKKSILSKFAVAALVPWNPFAAQSLLKHATEYDPDIIHFHNTFPLISPAGIHAVRKLRSATVLTLHNYRIICAAGTFLRKGNVCTECAPRRSITPALRHGCYRESRLATIPAAANIYLNKTIHTYEKYVDALIALTDFQRETFVNSGFQASSIHIRHQYYNQERAPEPWCNRENNVIFIGRLSPEKGIAILLDAWAKLSVRTAKLLIVGDGPLKEEIAKKIADYALQDSTVMMGPLPQQETHALLRRSRLLVVPSICFEGFPMVIREAYAAGVPVLSSDIGSLSSLVRSGETGALVAPDDPKALSNKIQHLLADPMRLEKLAEGAAKAYETTLTPKTSIERLLKIYELGTQARQNRG